jgi:hypothetical protein
VRSLVAAVVLGVAAAVPMPAAMASGGSGSPVNVANPQSPFPPDKAAEAAVAINPVDTSMVVASAFDETDEAPCGTPAATTRSTPCAFAPGVGTSGIYFSYDRGNSWTQPTYTGLTAASGTVQTGPIHTLPWYAESGLVSDADSAVAFGPVPDSRGHFSWANGVRTYVGNLTLNLSSTPQTEAFKGFASVAVSRIDNPTADRITDQNNWFHPVIAVTRQSSVSFEDKDQVWADNAASSPFFGTAYACFVDFRGNGHFQNGNEPAPLIVSVSHDGGSTWRQNQLNAAGTAPQSQQGFGTSDCTIRTDSHGVAYLFALRFALGTPGIDSHVVFKSFDGGFSWTAAQPLVTVNDACFNVDPVQGRCVSDGIAGSRIDLSPGPSVDIANGAPSGQDATNEIVDVWVDGRAGLNHEQVMLAFSRDGAGSFSSPSVVSGPGRGFYAAPAIAPDGGTMYVSASWLLADYQSTTTNPRPEQNTLMQSSIGSDGAPTGWSTAVAGEPGDLRAASANGLTAEFSGDYDYASAARDYGVGIWTADARDASDCPAIDAYRGSLATSSPLPQPNPATDCPPSFGNINIFDGTTG